MKKVKVGIIQISSREWGVRENFEKGETMIKKAASEGAKIICTPEGYLDGYPIGNAKKRVLKNFKDRLKRTSETTERYYIEKIRSLAQKVSAYLLVGFSEMSKGNLYNSVAFIGPDGIILGVYRKIHIPKEKHPESQVYTPGEEFLVFPTNFGNIGIMICYDRQFPESARTLRLMGADIIFNPSATWAFGSTNIAGATHNIALPPPSWNEAMMRTRAYENQVYIVCVNLAAPRLVGQSLFLDPMGCICLRASKDERVYVEEVDLDFLKKIRSKQGPPLTDRYPGRYLI